ncbi:hypothetical protein KW801_00275 [Candidatus Saccharibacteria bacterium]|nr:hypothetical protein [Candidatus Saccharibacteria bacterium]
MRISQNMSTEQVWALSAREYYNWQLEQGYEEPFLSQYLILTSPGGKTIEELGHLGLKVAAYSDGVRIEPESKYPRRGEDQLSTEALEVA